MKTINVLIGKGIIQYCIHTREFPYDNLPFYFYSTPILTGKDGLNDG